MPGPMSAWAKSTGATGAPSSRLLVISSKASGKIVFSSRTNSRLEIDLEWRFRFLQTRTIDDASAFTFFLRFPVNSVLNGQVPVIPKPASTTACKKVSHPVLIVPSFAVVSDCLNA